MSTITASVGVEPTREQLRIVFRAIRLWKDEGEIVVAKMMADGRMLLATCCEGTWSFLHVERDGMSPGDWF